MHSEIEGNLANYFYPKHPEFPADGQELECPNCKTTARYQWTDLRYDARGGMDFSKT
jgi:hypothetical protein